MTNTYNVEKLERATAIKKDFQKIVKKFRDAKPEYIHSVFGLCKDEYPKAMMTRAQIDRNTATINFGFNNERHHEDLDAFAASEDFKKFCAKHGVMRGNVEISSDNYMSFRIYY